MNTNDKRSVGFIQVVYADTTSNQVLTLGGAGFVTKEEYDTAWANVTAFTGETNLMADRMDANYDIVDNKPVSVETCERLMGKSIDELITAARAKLLVCL